MSLRKHAADLTASWQGWPPWIFELWVDAYFLGQAMRTRVFLDDLVAFTNPGLEDALYFDKFDFLERMRRAGYRVPRSIRIPGSLPAAGRLAEARRFLAAERLGLPVVLKPASGGRGRGVVRIDRDEELEAALPAMTADQVLQERCDLPVELGVFYLRPGLGEPGRVVEINEKAAASVRGDGQRTLEALIRAAGSKKERLFLQTNAKRLGWIPEIGCEIPLTFTRNHATGGIVKPVAGFDQARVDAFFDRLSDDLGGFCYGRYDLLTDSVSALERGERERIVFLEANGVGSELLSINHPGTSFVEAVEQQCAVVREMFEIVRRNRGRLPAPARKSGFRFLRYFLRVNY